MLPQEKLTILNQFQTLIDETIEISNQLLDLSEKYNKELDKDMVYEHMEFLEKRKQELERETKRLEALL